MNYDISNNNLFNDTDLIIEDLIRSISCQSNNNDDINGQYKYHNVAVSLVPVNSDQSKNHETPSNNITSSYEIVKDATLTFALINLSRVDVTNTAQTNGCHGNIIRVKNSFF